MLIPLRRRAGRVGVCRRAERTGDGRADDPQILPSGGCGIGRVPGLSGYRGFCAPSRRAQGGVAQDTEAAAEYKADSPREPFA